MCRHLIILLVAVLLSTVTEAKTLKVAVIDTGYNFSFKNYVHFKLTKPKLCRTGHKDFTNTTLEDTNGHGSNVTSLIAKNNSESDYCIIVLKFWTQETTLLSLNTEIEAINYAMIQKVDVINMSISGLSYSEEECTVVKNALNKGIKIVAAAGNDALNLDKVKSYPASCDSRIRVVMNYNKDTRHYTSNYGKKLIKEQGTYMYGVGSTELPIILTGSSQAAAVHTGKLIRTLGSK